MDGLPVGPRLLTLPRNPEVKLRRYLDLTSISLALPVKIRM